LFKKNLFKEEALNKKNYGSISWKKKKEKEINMKKTFSSNIFCIGFLDFKKTYNFLMFNIR